MACADLILGEKQCISSILQEDSKASEDTGKNDSQAIAVTQAGHGSSGTLLVGSVCCGGATPAAGRRESGLGWVATSG